MPGVSASRGHRVVRAVGLSAVALLGFGYGGSASASGSRPVQAPAHTATGIPLLQPVHGVDPLANVNLGLRPDRLKKSIVPGPVDDLEQVRVLVGPSGAPAAVTDRQQLVLHSAGNYVVRELGPARAAIGLGNTVPPVLELGTVVWQGFSPGARSLSALLTLDPGIEATRLPMKVGLQFRNAAGRVLPLRPGAAAPADGTVTVTLSNNTGSPRSVVTGVADVRPMAQVLDRLRVAAGRPRAAVPPVAGAGLPATVPGQAQSQLSLNVVAPLRVTGTLTAPGGTAAIRGPGLSPAVDGASIAGTLSGSVTFQVSVHAGDRLGMKLDVRPWLDPRLLLPPSGVTWRQWAATHPAASAVAQATQTMVTAAATAARAAEYSPYLQADAPGPDLSTFTYVVAPPRLTPVAARPLSARPGAITAASIALLAIVANAAFLRRRL